VRRLALIGHPYVALVLRLALAGVFLWAGVAKASDPHAFGLEIARYRMVPEGLVNLMAIMLPWIELVAAVGLVAGLWARPCALACTGMLLVFIVAVASALRRGLDISCGCFGGGADAARLSQTTLWRDLLWLAWAVHVAIFDRGVLGVQALLERRAARRRSSP
jgi:putative oxidoreductase